MKITRTLTLGQALDEVVQMAQMLKSGPATAINGRRLDLKREVEYHLAFEDDGGEIELDFEIKWKARRQGAGRSTTTTKRPTKRTRKRPATSTTKTPRKTAGRAAKRTRGGTARKSTRKRSA
jgi:hypothetical protein